MEVPLLPSGPIKVIRDAARAVKRKAKLVMKRVSANTLSSLLGLPGMIVTEYAIEREEGTGREILHVFCQHEHDVAACPNCGEVSTAIHEEEERCIRHLDIWGKRPMCIFLGGVLTVDIVGSRSRKCWRGLKTIGGKAGTTNCMCMNSASIRIKRRWRKRKDCTARQ